MKKLKVLLMGMFMVISYNSLSQTPTERDVLDKKVKGNLQSVQLRDSTIFTVGDEVELGVATGANKYRFLSKTVPCLFSTDCTGQFAPLQGDIGGSIVTVNSIKATMGKVVIVLSHGQGSIYEIRVASITSAVRSKELIFK